MKKVLMIFLIVLLSVQPLAVFGTENVNKQPFSDIDGHWAETTINENYEKGMVIGYPNETFKPDQNMKRSELITFINRYFGLKQEADTNFEDVSGKEWYAYEAAKTKYYEYVEELKLKPEESAAREDVINMLSIMLDIEEQEDISQEVMFTDLENIDDETREKIYKFSQLGYIAGYEDGTFKPEGTITRAEILTIFENSLGYIVRNQEDLDAIPSDVKKVTIINPNIVIENKEFEGDLYIGPGADGNVTIKNTTVKGKIEIAGGELDKPIVLENIKTDKVVITKSKETPEVQIKGQSTIGELKTKSYANIELLGDTEIQKFMILAKIELDLRDKSKITLLTTEGDANIQTEAESEIVTLQACEKTNISGKGEIKKAYIKDKEVVIDNRPQYLKIDTSVGKVEIGGKLINYKNDDYRKSSTSSSVTTVTTTEINIKTNPIDINYKEGDNLDLTGLVVTITKSDSSTEDVEYADFSSENITTNPINGTALSTTNTAITVNIDSLTTSFNITVEEPDTTVPTIIDSTITSPNATLSSIDLSWTKATDDITSSSDLEYKVYYSTSDNLDTLENTEANGIAVGDYEKDINTKTITDLTENTTYYFNIIVKDEAGNKVCYGVVSKSTLAPVITTGISVKTNPTHVNYKEGDNLDLTGLVVTITKSDSSTEDVEYADFSLKSITTNPVNGTALSTANTAVTVNIDSLSTSFNITVEEPTPASTMVGSGTADEPFIINSLEGLVAVGRGLTVDGVNDYSLSSYYELGKDLDFTLDSSYEDPSGKDIFDVDEDSDVDEILKDALTKVDESDTGKGFKPIGDSTSYFKGNFNGKQHEIANLYINRVHEDYVGLFGYVQCLGISNLGIVNIDVTGGNYIGGLIGYTSNNFSRSISDVFAEGKVTGKGTTGYIGGLIGYSKMNSISNSYANVTVTSISDYVGGLLGYTYKGSISNSYSTGSVTAEGEKAGGLVGYNRQYCNITNAYSTSEVNGKNFVGGLVGQNSKCDISNSIAYNLKIKISVTGRVNRITGMDSSSIFTNNYAYENMEVKAVGEDRTIYPGLANINGADIIADNLKSLDFYTNSDNWGTEGENTLWDFTDIWEIKDGANRPTLKHVGNDDGK